MGDQQDIVKACVANSHLPLSPSLQMRPCSSRRNDRGNRSLQAWLVGVRRSAREGGGKGEHGIVCKVGGKGTGPGSLAQSDVEGGAGDLEVR